MKYHNAAWNGGNAFDRCADLILDGVEDAFQIKAPNGRAGAHRTIVDVLAYYCVPKRGEATLEQVERQLALMRKSRGLARKQMEIGE